MALPFALSKRVRNERNPVYFSWLEEKQKVSINHKYYIVNNSIYVVFGK